MLLTRSRSDRLTVGAGALAVFAITSAPTAMADSVAQCTSDIVDGVEVDYCIGDPNTNTITDVPGVNLEWELSFAVGLGF